MLEDAGLEDEKLTGVGMGIWDDSIKKIQGNEKGSEKGNEKGNEKGASPSKSPGGRMSSHKRATQIDPDLRSGRKCFLRTTFINEMRRRAKMEHSEKPKWGLGCRQPKKLLSDMWGGLGGGLDYEAMLAKGGRAGEIRMN